MLVTYPEDSIVHTCVLPGQLRLIGESDNGRMRCATVGLNAEEWPTDRAIKAWAGFPPYAHIIRGMVKGRALLWVAK